VGRVFCQPWVESQCRQKVKISGLSCLRFLLVLGNPLPLTRDVRSDTQLLGGVVDLDEFVARTRDKESPHTMGNLGLLRVIASRDPLDRNTSKPMIRVALGSREASRCCARLLEVES